MATKKRPFTLRLDEDTYVEIGRLACEDNRSMTNYIEHILLLHIKEIRQKKEAEEEAKTADT